MLRFGRHLKNRCEKYGKNPLKYQNARNLSTSGTGGGTGRALLIVSGTVVAGGAASVGVAWQKPEFRKTIEDNVPVAHYLFDPILGAISGTTDLVPKKTTDPFESSLRQVRKKIEKKEQKLEKEIDKDVITTEITEPAVENMQQVNDNTRKEIADETVQAIEENIYEVKSKEVFPELPTVAIETQEKELLDQTVIQTKDIVEEEPQTSNIEPVVETKAEDISQTVTSMERTPREVEESLLQLQEEVLADAAATSTIITEVLASCAQRCMEAIESNSEAMKAISLHTSLLRNAMDETQGSSEDKKEQWTDVSRVLEQKSRLQGEADETYREARQELTKLKSIIEEAKKMNNAEVNNRIIEAEENHSAMSKEMEEVRNEVNMKISESHVMSQYQGLVETAKEQFRQELLSVMPDVKLEPGWRGLSQKLTQDDLNALIAHAHRRVDQLQRELAEERAISTRRMEMAVRAARERWQDEKDTEVAKKIEQLREEMELEHDKKMQDARHAFESEVLLQLKRQAAAHSEHLTDMLGIQEKQIKAELRTEFQIELETQERQFLDKMDKLKETYENDIYEIRERFHFDLNKALAHVSGIESAIDGRAHIENESRKAQELWLACEALRIALEYGDNGKPTPLQSELKAIVQVHGVEPSVQEVAKSFPEEAIERGVFTEESLRISYKQVSKMCRRLSMVSETRNSLFTYILSYLKSFLIISRVQTEPPSDLKMDGLSTFHILAYTTYCLEHGDLEQATRFMNQLTGEPRRVAEGWLKEARLLLETKQTVQALSSLASAISIAANLEM